MARRPKIWILVADGARGRFFEPDWEGRKLTPVGPGNLVAPQSRQRPRELESDKPGRGYSAARSGARHAFEPPHDPHKLEKHRFMVVLADALDQACRKGEFTELVVVAPRRSLGELRGLLSKRVQDCVHGEVAKDVTNETAASLWRRLGPLLAPPRVSAAAGTARKTRS
jgi:protein required for attachment to host cells